MSLTQSDMQKQCNDNDISRTSLTTNSSQSRLVRKRDSSVGPNSRSKSKDNSSTPKYETYLKHFQYASPSQLDIKKSLEQLREAPQPIPVNSVERKSSFSRIRPSKLVQEEPTPMKKRTPTPVRSRRENCTQAHPVSAENTIFKLQLSISELQNELTSERTSKKKLEQENISLNKSVFFLKRQNEELKKSSAILLSEKEEYGHKITALKKAIFQSESSLENTQNNLNKLKQTIKQNKLEELHQEIRRCHKENQCLRSTICQLQSDKMNMLQEIANSSRLTESLSSQLQELKDKYQTSKCLSTTSSMISNIDGQFQLKEDRQPVLEETIRASKEENRRLADKIQKMKLYIHSLNFNQQSELIKVRKQKENELKKVKSRYCKMICELRNKMESGRDSLFETSRSREDEVSFELSPQK